MTQVRHQRQRVATDLIATIRADYELIRRKGMTKIN